MLKSPMSDRQVIALANHLIDRFQPGHELTSEERLSIRFLTCGALLGIGVAVCAGLISVVTGLWQAGVLIGAFGLGLVAVLAGVRRGRPLATLSRACLLLLGAFLVGISLLTVDLQWTQLRWLVLLPVVSLFLSDARPDRGRMLLPMSMLGRSTMLAIALGTLVIVANRLGWTFGLHEAPVDGLDVAAVVDFVLFTVSIAGLLWIHQVALRKTEEELQLLRSMLSVCAWCRRIHDDVEGWVGVEHYMARHNSAVTTHGICPDCEQKVWES